MGVISGKENTKMLKKSPEIEEVVEAIKPSLFMTIASEPCCVIFSKSSFWWYFFCMLLA